MQGQDKQAEGAGGSSRERLVTVPAELVARVRQGAFVAIGAAAQAIDGVVFSSKRGAHPEWFRGPSEDLRAAAARADVPFLEWTPEGPLAYNPYGHGSDSEIADKALSGEEFTEPHYLRQAQRYLGHAVRVMQAAGIKITPVSLMAHMDPRQLEVSARKLPEEQAKAAQDYLDSLEDRQKRELSGVRDRLSILAESDVRQWLNPAPGESALDLQKAIRKRAVVYFRLDSDRRPLLSKMLAATIISDLVTLTAWMQTHPLPTLVLVDEFSAIAAQQISRLFGRGRSAAISLLLATQEMADMPATGDGALREQVLGNVEAVIAHRQNVPESAELIAAPSRQGHEPLRSQAPEVMNDARSRERRHRWRHYETAAGNQPVLDCIARFPTKTWRRSSPP
jgi:TraM recognition site of TraD and TraG